MGMWLRHRDPDIPGGAAVPAAKASRGARLMRSARTRWWPRWALGGVVLTVIGVTLLSGPAQAGIALLGITVFLVSLLTGLGVHDREPVRVQVGRDLMTQGRSSEIGSRREPPVPPSENGPG
jgi:hypothetical protein